MDVSLLIVFAHGGLGNVPDMDELMFLFPTIPLILIGTIVLASVLHRRGLLGPDRRTVSLTATGAAVAATLSTGAGAIHLSVVPAHVAEFAPFGVAFLVVGWFQVVWAQLYLLKPTRITALAGSLVSAAVVVAWLASRTVGLPVGPTPWTPEAIGALDLFATGFEVALIGVLMPMIVPSRWPVFEGRRMTFERAFVLATFCLLTVTLLTTLAMIGAPGVEASIQP